MSEEDDHDSCDSSSVNSQQGEMIDPYKKLNQNIVMDLDIERSNYEFRMEYSLGHQGH